VRATREMDLDASLQRASRAPVMMSSSASQAFVAPSSRWPIDSLPATLQTPTTLARLPVADRAAHLLGSSGRTSGTSSVAPVSRLASLAAVIAATSLLATGKRRRRRRLSVSRWPRGCTTTKHGDTSPQLPFFEPHAQRIQDLLVQRLRLVEEPVEAHLQQRSGGKGGRAKISSYVYKGSADSPVRRFRMVLVCDGPQLQAFNAVLYPKYDLGLLPVLGVDVLSFNKHQRLLFGADWAPMLPTAAYAEAYIVPYLANVRAKLGNSLGAPSGKFYGEEPEFFSPAMYFSRPEGPEVLLPGGDLWAVFEDYVQVYADMLEEVSVGAIGTRHEDAAVAEERQRQFDAWHIERDPAVKIFMRLFGEEWTEQYLREVLFPGAFVGATKLVQGKAVHVK